MCQSHDAPSISAVEEKPVTKKVRRSRLLPNTLKDIPQRRTDLELHLHIFSLAFFLLRKF